MRIRSIPRSANKHIGANALKIEMDLVLAKLSSKGNSTNYDRSLCADEPLSPNLMIIFVAQTAQSLMILPVTSFNWLIAPR